ncbi:MAG: LysM peptidoglycan-binding domain-containing protein [Chloracidobacterium sp.]|nr:LysM peptidoglycan-binding domain-containing protein [Chloracidobacterium sp.]MDW8216867.1 LysM peptidoglycan-binding domain-containing protein [Acidobacteriota bacterium]
MRVNATRGASPASQSNSVQHVVRRGETLSGIARQYGVTVQTIVQANRQIRNPNLIYAGQTLTIPRNASTTPPQSSTGDRQYVVRSGDTLSEIAARNGIDLQRLIEANLQIRNPNLIYPGQVINLPGGGNGRQPVTTPAQPTQPTQPSQPAPPAAREHRVRIGDTLSGIARRYGTSVDALLRANPSITNPNLIYPGQRIIVPGGASPTPPPTLTRPTNPTQPTQPTPPTPPGALIYDGTRPAPGTTNVRAWEPINAPLQGDPANRNRATYDNVINQFAVGVNPRYARREGNTYCNIFVWDVTRAMRAEIPHWVDANGNPTAVGRGRELDANATNQWLNTHGGRFGWREVSAEEAQRLANQGHPVVASWRNPGGIGHIAIVRPGEMTSRGPAIAQAGARNFNYGQLQDGFGNARGVQFFVNDRGTVGNNPAPTPTPPPTNGGTPPRTGLPVPQVDLQRGSRGEAVQQLQAALVRLGYMSQADMNTGPGVFGPRTEAALKAFQSANGVPATGYYGPLTRSALTRALSGATAPTPPPANGGMPPQTTYDVQRVLNVVPASLRSYAQDAVPRILAEAQRAGLTLEQTAYVLATAQYESGMGRWMTEIWGPTAAQRGYEGRRDLGNTQPGDGYRYRGRGYVQITGRANYTDWSRRLGMDLVGQPDLATRPEIAARILVIGMRDGTFTGRKLSDYINGNQVDFVNARRTVNGLDRADLIASYAQAYLQALRQ